MQITTRPALDTDKTFAFNVKKAALGAYVAETWGWDEEFQIGFHERDWVIRRPDVIESDGQAIGTLEVARFDDHWVVGEFYLLPEWQRRGIGTQLLRDLLARADAVGTETRLQFLKVNPVRTLYERHGFSIVNETSSHYFAIRPPAGA